MHGTPYPMQNMFMQASPSQSANTENAWFVSAGKGTERTRRKPRHDNTSPLNECFANPGKKLTQPVLKFAKLAPDGGRDQVSVLVCAMYVINPLENALLKHTVIVARMSHWKWRETKQRPSRAVSLHFLRNILATITVNQSLRNVEMEKSHVITIQGGWGGWPTGNGN